MKAKQTMIHVSTATHAILKRHASRLGVSMSEVIGAALEAFDRRSEEDKQKSLAVWMALHDYMTTMSPSKKR